MAFVLRNKNCLYLRVKFFLSPAWAAREVSLKTLWPWPQPLSTSAQRVFPQGTSWSIGYIGIFLSSILLNINNLGTYFIWVSALWSRLAPHSAHRPVWWLFQNDNFWFPWRNNQKVQAQQSDAALFILLLQSRLQNMCFSLMARCKDHQLQDIATMNTKFASTESRACGGRLTGQFSPWIIRGSYHIALVVAFWRPQLISKWRYEGHWKRGGPRERGFGWTEKSSRAFNTYLNVRMSSLSIFSDVEASEPGKIARVSSLIEGSSWAKLRQNGCGRDV